jgi:ACT domain-containing protein
MRAILTVTGKDKPGIIAAVSAKLFSYNSNILDVTQTVLRDDLFTMIMLVDIGSINAGFGEFKAGILACCEEIGMEAQVQREELFKSMHRI